MGLRQESEQKHPRQRLAALSQSKADILVFWMHPSRFPFTCHPHQAAASQQCHCLLSNVPQQPQPLCCPGKSRRWAWDIYVSIWVPRCKPNPRLPFADSFLTSKQKNKSAERSALQIHRQGLKTTSKNEEKKRKQG